MWQAQLLNSIAGLLAGGVAAGGGTSYESISTVTVGAGGVSSITFSSIPSTYTHLQIRGIIKSASTAAQNFSVAMNSDTTQTNYYSHYIYGGGASVGSGAFQSSGYYAFIGGEPSSNASYANMFGGFVTDILDYKNTNKYKTIRSIYGFDRNGSGEIGLTSGLWKNTNAVTDLTINISTAVANISQYSSFALYGIKGA